MTKRSKGTMLITMTIVMSFLSGIVAVPGLSCKSADLEQSKTNPSQASSALQGRAL